MKKIILTKGTKIFVRTVYNSIPEITVTFADRDIEFDESELFYRDGGLHGVMYTYVFKEPLPTFQGSSASKFFFYRKDIT